MTRILLFGAQGLLGSAVFNAAADHHDFAVIPLGRFNYDLTDPEQIRQAFDEQSADAVINCAAFAGVDAAEDPERRELLFALNAEAPRIMAEQCAARNLPFVHISTDYVFDGTRGEYREDDLPHPVNSYGESKLAGEEAVLTAYPGATVVRTARLFGATGENFVTSLKIPARRGRPIRAVEDERGSFTYAPDLAARLLELLSAGCPSGILHLAGAEAASPYEVAQAVVELLASSSTVTPIAAADLERPAARPPDTSLRCTRQPPLRGFRDALPDLFRLRK